MPQPDFGDHFVSTLLSGVSVGYQNDTEGYVADRVLPPVFVDEQSGLIARYDQGAFFADEGERMIRAPGTRAATSGWNLAPDLSYLVKNYALGVEIPDEMRRIVPNVFQLDDDATRFLTHLQMIRRERQFSTGFMTTGVWGEDVTVSAKWSDYGASDPIGDIDAYSDAIESRIGRRPNKLVLGAIGWRRLKHHPDFLARVSGGATNASPATVNRNLVAQMFELDDIIVARASYRSSAEGQATTLARIIDDDALLLYSPNTNPGLMDPSAGYTFVWRPMSAPGAIQYIRKGREERDRYDWVESWSYVDQKVIEPMAGVFFGDVVD